MIGENGSKNSVYYEQVIDKISRTCTANSTPEVHPTPKRRMDLEIPGGAHALGHINCLNSGGMYDN